MAERMLKFTVTPRTDAGEARGRRARAATSTKSTRLHRRQGGGAGLALLAMRRALLSDPLPAAQQHPRLAAHDRRGPAGGGLRALLQATNSMPEVCGRICPQDRLCEGNCVIEQSGHGTVTIGAVERYITDKAWEKGWVQPPAPARDRGQSVGIIGAGPAGLAAAERLRELGYAGHRLRPPRPRRRPAGLRHPRLQAGEGRRQRRTDAASPRAAVEFVLDFEVGRDASLGELRRRHDAVLIATGVYTARDIERAGRGLGRRRAGAGLPDRLQPQGPGRRGRRPSTAAR